MYYDLWSGMVRSGRWDCGGCSTYLMSSRRLAMEPSEFKSRGRIVGGFARVRPVPVTSHPLRWNSFMTCLPRRPVPPVMRAVFDIVCCVFEDPGG